MPVNDQGHPDPSPPSSEPAHTHHARKGRVPVAPLLLLVAAGGALVVAFAVRGGVAAPAADVAQPTAEAAMPVVPPSALTADHATHEFGDVPIGGGHVQAVFKLTNDGADSTRIVAAYTSCMCTTATLGFPDGTTAGPFGMPGHDLPLTLDRWVGAHKAVTVTVDFDPAAHGPDAIGPVERQVTIHTADGAAATVAFTANVTKG